MSYRNDHEATLARVDALELELAVLKGEQSRPRPRRRRGRSTMLRAAPAVAVATIASSAIAAMFVFGNDNTVSSRVGHGETKLVGQVSRERLDDCVAKLPRTRTHAVQMVAASGACRALLTGYVKSLISNDEHAAASRWLAAEDELANEISLITVYYGSDPERVDHYASAPQLWREYDRAYERRQLALEKWRGVVK